MYLVQGPIHDAMHHAMDASHFKQFLIGFRYSTRFRFGQVAIPLVSCELMIPITNHFEEKPWLINQVLILCHITNYAKQWQKVLDASWCSQLNHFKGKHFLEGHAYRSIEMVIYELVHFASKMLGTCIYHVQLWEFISQLWKIQVDERLPSCSCNMG